MPDGNFSLIKGGFLSSRYGNLLQAAEGLFCRYANTGGGGGYLDLLAATSRAFEGAAPCEVNRQRFACILQNPAGS